MVKGRRIESGHCDEAMPQQGRGDATPPCGEGASEGPSVAMARTLRDAGALLIGDELLSGKVRDANGPLLARVLFDCGIRLRRLLVCPDEPAEIVEELRRLTARYDVVFTSGGLGPTHDDVTVEAVAEALERPLVRDRRLERMLAAFYGERLTEAHRRMAWVPVGTELLTCEGLRFPVLKVDRVFVLPGVPRFFEHKVHALRPWLQARSGRPLHSRSLRVAADEGLLAPLLAKVAARFPAVHLGSYPRQRADGRWYVLLACDGEDERQLEAACQALRREIERLESVGRLEEGAAEDGHGPED